MATNPHKYSNLSTRLPGWALLVLAAFVGCSPSDEPSAPVASTPEQFESAATKQEAERDPAPPAPLTEPRPEWDDDLGSNEPVVQQYRHPEDRPELNERRLAAAGIHRLESRHLVLLTDCPPESVSPLLPLADELYTFLESACGPLLPAADGGVFQVTGCLMDDDRHFAAIDLTPDERIEMAHGHQQGYRFWMRNQEDDYYVRHLLLHEFVHCYMNCESRPPGIRPQWFMEGAAELFATHRPGSEATEFAVMPPAWEGFEGWGRISEMRRHLGTPFADDLSLQSIPSLDDVQNPAGQLARDDGRYAFWWALCWMLRNHPNYSDDWKSLCKTRSGEAFAIRYNELAQQQNGRLESDWLLFADSVCEGFDTARGFAIHSAKNEAFRTTLTLRADAGWQDTGRDFVKGDACQIKCDGQCVLATTTAAWVAESQGITIEYHRGRPLGEVLAVLVDAEGGKISCRLPIGRGRGIRFPRNGRLWLQINDSAASRRDNSGHFKVSIQVN